MTQPIGDGDREHYARLLCPIVRDVAKTVNPWCPVLELPVVKKEDAGRNGSTDNIAGQMKQFFLTKRRITARNGRPAEHNLRIGICFGFFWPESWESPPHLGIQVAHENKKISDVRSALETALDTKLDREIWKLVKGDREGDQDDWTVLDARRQGIPPSNHDRVREWFIARFRDLKDAGVLGMTNH